MAGPDPKPEAPVREKGALARIHRANPHATCALCGAGRTGMFGISLHHVYDRSDLWQNLVFVCGTGTTGCHGLLTINNEEARRRLGEHLLLVRHDVIAWIVLRAGEDGARDWLRRRLFVSV